jgi:hypothetical protein
MKTKKVATTDKHKIFIAGFLTLLVMVGIITVSNIFFSPKQEKTQIDNTNTVDKQSIIDEINKSAQSGIKAKDTIVQTVSLNDLPVYPEAWQKKYFSPIELANELISGPAADYDKDGLTNKDEYFQGSNPTNKDTLCDGKTDGNKCTGKTDGENVAAGINPLTGLAIDTPQKFVIKRQDYAILNNIENTFETAAREGVDFPTLYVLSKTIDLNSELDQIQVQTQEDKRENVINYIKLRVNILEGFSSEDELTTFAEIYQITNIKELENAKQKYIGFREKLSASPVPESYTASHKSYLHIFTKLTDLIDLRIKGLNDKTLLNDDFRELNKKKGIEVVWAYKKLAEVNDEFDKTNTKETIIPEEGDPDFVN